MADERQLAMAELERRGVDPLFIQRINNPWDFPVLENPDGSVSTHRMAWGEDERGPFAFPTIIMRDGKLEQLPMREAAQYAMRTGNLKRFDDPKEAEAWAEGGYKTPEFQEYGKQKRQEYWQKRADNSDPFYVLGNSPLVETLLQGITGTGATIAGGLAGIAGLPFGIDAAANAVRRTQEALTYQPRSKQAQEFGQAVGELMAPIEQGKQWLGDKAYEATGSPLAATIASVSPEIIEAALGLRAAKGLGGQQYEIGDIGGQATGMGRREMGAVGGAGKPKKGYKRLYRGMESEFDPRYDLTRTDAPSGYSTWTDNPDLAKQYAGESGHIYYIDLPESMQGVDLIDEHGERPLFINNEKPAGLGGVSGDEYLLYVDHDDYNPSDIKLLDAERGDVGGGSKGADIFTGKVGNIPSGSAYRGEVYHFTDKHFDEFDFEKSADQTVWFGTDLDEMMQEGSAASAASGKGNIVKADVQLDKVAGWDELDRYSIDELIQQGYDGAILDGDVQVFDPKAIKRIKR